MISLYKSRQTHTCNYKLLLTVFEIARRMSYSLMMNSNEQLHVGRVNSGQRGVTESSLHNAERLSMCINWYLIKLSSERQVLTRSKVCESL